MTDGSAGRLPHRTAVLCYVYDDDGRILLLHRRKKPNSGMYSPVGGKVEVDRGEGPHECAIREIHEELGLVVTTDEVRLTGLVSERAYEGQTHWLIFLFEVTRPVSADEIERMEFDEGRLEWVPIERVPDLAIPDTDRHIMWPLVQRHRAGFFAVHIDCTIEPPDWELTESVVRYQ